MKSRFYFVPIVILMMVCAVEVQAQLEPIGGPYTVDTNTVVLLHFDGAMTNAAAAVGKTDTAAVRNTTNPAKIYFLNNTGVAGMGQCVRLDNGAITDSTYLTVADTAALDMTGSWTIEAWANIFTFGDNAQDYRWVPRVSMKPADVTFYDGANWWLEMWGDNRLFHGGYVAESGTYVSVTSPNNMFVPGEWVHLTFIRDADRAFIAVMVHDKDKNLKGFLTQGFTKGDKPKTTKQAMHIGWAGAKEITNASGDSWLDGFIDELRISKVVRNFAGPPVISDKKVLPNQPSTATSYEVSVTAFPLNAGGSITSAVVMYRTDTVGAFTGIPLTPGANNTFTGSLPGQTFGKVVYYYYKVTDNNGLSSLYPSNAEAATNPTRLSFGIYKPYSMVLDLTFEEGPTNPPIDHSPNNATIVTRVQTEYSTDVPMGGGTYSWQVRSHPGIAIDSNWCEAVSPFLAVEEFTLDHWIKADSADRHAVRWLINPSAETDWNNANFEMSFRNGAAGVPVITARYWNNDGTGANTIQDTVSAATAHVGKWRHIILERSKTKFGMVIKDENNQLLFRKVIDAPKPPLMAGAPLRIGRSWFDGNDNYYVGPFRGLIDNVKVYNYPAAGVISGEEPMPLETVGGPYTVDTNTVVLLHFDGNMANAAAAVGKTDTAARRNTTNPAKIYFLNNTGVAGMGQCVRLDNGAITDSTYLTVADTAALDMTGSWTIEAWANIFTFGDNAQDYRWVPRVSMKPADVTFYDGANWWLEMWGDNRLFHGGYVAESGTYVSVTSPNNMFVPGEWVHLTFVRDAERAFIAVMVHDKDKNLKGFLTQGFTKGDKPKTTKQAMHIGWAGAKEITNASGDSWLDGFIDELRISKVVRNYAGPPVISDKKVLPNQPSTATSYEVSVTAFPLNAGGVITNAEVKYRTDTVGAFISVPLTPGANNTFTGNLPGQTFGKVVYYYYKVTDNNGLSSLYPSNAEAATNPTRLSFGIYQPNSMVLNVTFEEGPTNPPIDHSPNNARIVTRVQKDYSTDVPTGGGTYSWQLKTHPGIAIDSNWCEAVSPFLAVEEFTLDHWIKADSADRHAVRWLINPSAETDWNNANFEMSFRNGAAGVPVITARYWNNDGTGANTIQDTIPGTAHVGKWRHVILERSKTKFALAVKNENDQMMFTKTIDAAKPPLMAGAPLRIGRSWFDGNDNYYVGPYRGRIDNVKVYNYPAAGIITGVGEEGLTPLTFALEQNYPNPFNPTTRIAYTIPSALQTNMVVYDLLGRRVKTLVNEVQHAGEHSVQWNGVTDDGTSVASGVYFVRLTAGDFVKTVKMMLMR